MSAADATTLAEQIRRGYVFARRGGQSNFYIQRALSFGGSTVVELFGPGPCSNAAASERAVTAENVVASSLVLAGERDRYLQQAIGRRTTHTDLLLNSRNSRLAVSSTAATELSASGALIGLKAAQRYQRNGFATLYDLAVATTELGGRVSAALTWLMESRIESVESAAVVKTAIALEGLLVVGREPTTRATGERSAYLLSDDPDERIRINAATQRFYEVRSSVVHGGRAVPQDVIRAALRYADRVVVMLMLVLAAQSSRWKSITDVQRYCDDVRWGRPQVCSRPWRRDYLRRTLARFRP